MNGEEIELYKFDPDAENAKRARETGTMQMNGFSLPVVYNERLNVALAGHDEHPQKEELEEIFPDI